MKLSINRGAWITGLLGLSIVVVSVYLILSLLNSHLDQEVQRRAISARDVVLAQIQQSGWTYAEDDELWAFGLPYVRGVEVFSEDGRRIWAAGEPLEIVGYKLDRDTPLTHISTDNAAREYYWPANLLSGQTGVAVRVDFNPQRAAIRRLGNRLLLLFGATLVAVCIVVIWVYQQRQQDKSDI